KRGDPFPLTEIQQAYWIGRSAAHEIGDVSIHAYVEVEGDGVDLRGLERAWQQVVARHDMLRAIVLPDGRQRILPAVPRYELQVTDMREQSPDLPAAALAATREELSHQVLPAESWPGFDIRATLLDGGRTRVHISIDLLHIDGGSLMILIDEWMRLYRDSAADLPQLDLSYRDYVLGEIAVREGEGYEQSVQYWRDRIATLPPAPVLPIARAQSAAARTRFRRRSATLEPGAWQRLKARATQSGLTPSAVLLSAYADVLGCWASNDAFTVNVTLFNRLPLHPQVNRILGDFTSLVLVAAAPTAERTFAERCATIQRELWAGLEHRHVSGIRVLRELARAQNWTAGALMPVVFTSMLDLAAQGFRPPFSPLRTLGEVVYSVTQTPQVWLDHQVLEEDGALILSWDSVEDLFPPGLLDDMFATYGDLLRKLADDEAAWQDRSRTPFPQQQLAQRGRLNATDVAVPPETLLTLFLGQAASRPDQPAVITSGRTLTYAETSRRANRLGRTLRTLGAQPNTLVAVVMDKGWEQAVATIGIHLAGAAYLPIDPSLPAERRRYLLADGQVRFVVTQPWLDRRLEWPADVELVCVDADEPPAEDDSRLEPVQGPGDLSHVIYTSGSTGAPKGVMIEHRNVVNRITDVNQRLGVGPQDRMLALSALHHDLSVYDIFGVLAAGAAMVIPDAERTRDPEHWAELMAREGVTMWNSVPAFLQMLVEYLEQRADQPQLMPRSLRCAVLAGDWIPVSLPNRLRRLVDGVQVFASGGPTETTIWDIWYPVESVDPAWPSIPYGKPMSNTRYYVLNRALEPCPVWVAGQIHIGGAGLARGYWRDAAKTRERFIAHPQTGERIYASGDMGRYLPDGNIEFLGRDDLQVKIRGHRVELGEIEAALREHPALDGAAVAALGETRQLTRLVAFVVPGGARTGAAGRNGKDPATFKQEFLTGVSVLDPAARIDFKLNQWGLRRDLDPAALAFPHGEQDEAVRRAEAERHSVRVFSADPLPFAALGELLRSLTQIETGDLPKYRYPSGGGLYPVQTYVYVKPDRVESVAGGVYYHDPKGHRLQLMSPGALLQADTQMPHNRAIFDQAAFVILLVGQRAAVEPLYGGLAGDFCLLEAGYMSQLLMTVAPSQQIGLCPVGAMEFEPVRQFFHLDDSHMLVHLLLGGPADDLPEPRPVTAHGAARARTSAALDKRGLVEELRTFLQAKLPAHMQPSAYVLLDSLPVTSEGKVDRRQLPALEVASPPDQRPDAPPRNEAERTLAAIAQKILQIDGVGIEQNFFDLGGDSVHMVKIMNEVREAFGREVPITEIFRHPTISSLAGYLSADDDAAELAGTDSDERASQHRASVARRNASRRERPARGQDGAVQC
ncbi:MAG: amino acid adenylation domain-containing protein, partial [Actinomycetota bacterium]|nr:amino acid adenylation domain-containing protein [Actinomycetota bacterium]